MTLTEKTTHVDEAVLLPVEQFRGKPKLAAFLTAFVNQLQELEAVFFDLMEDRWLDTAVGAQLDGLGEIVGVERLGLDDTDYRAAIRAKIRFNLSSGTIPDNTTILPLLISNSFEIVEWFPAAFDVVVSDAFTETASVIAKQLSKAAGVRAYLEYTKVDDDNTFSFADGDTAQTDADKGFAEELQTNGSFDNWTGDDPDNWTVTGESPPNREVSEVAPNEGHGGTGTGAANLYSDSATIVSMEQSVTTVIGETYALSFDLTKRVSGTLRVEGNSGSVFVAQYTAEGSYLIEFVAVGTSTAIKFLNKGASDVTIDNVAVHGDGGSWADAEVI